MPNQLNRQALITKNITKVKRKARKKNAETRLPKNTATVERQKQNDSHKSPTDPGDLTDEVRTEILSLADRPLSEAEVLEIYSLYSAGDKDNMLKKLKGVG